MDKITMKIKVGDRHFESGNYPSAIECYKKAAEAGVEGSEEASYKLGKIYEKGYGVCIDLQCAYNYYINAGKKGIADAARVKDLMEGKNDHRERRWEQGKQMTDGSLINIYESGNLIGQLSADSPEAKFLVTKPATGKVEFVPVEFSLKDLYWNNGILQKDGATIKFDTKQGNTIINCVLDEKEIKYRVLVELVGKEAKEVEDALRKGEITLDGNGEDISRLLAGEEKYMCTAQEAEKYKITYSTRLEHVRYNFYLEKRIYNESDRTITIPIRPEKKELKLSERLANLESKGPLFKSFLIAQGILFLVSTICLYCCENYKWCIYGIESSLLSSFCMLMSDGLRNAPARILSSVVFVATIIAAWMFYPFPDGWTAFPIISVVNILAGIYLTIRGGRCGGDVVSLASMLLEGAILIVSVIFYFAYKVHGLDNYEWCIYGMCNSVFVVIIVVCEAENEGGYGSMLMTMVTITATTILIGWYNDYGQRIAFSIIGLVNLFTSKMLIEFVNKKVYIIPILIVSITASAVLGLILIKYILPKY